MKFGFIFLLLFLSRTLAQNNDWENVSLPYGIFQSITSCDNSNSILLGTSKGIWKTSVKNLLDNSLNSKNNFLPENRINSFNKISRKFFACTNKGIYVSEDDGDSWIKTSLPDSSFYCMIFTTKNTIFAKASPGNIYSSKDLGKTWKEIFFPSSISNLKQLKWTWKIYSNKNGNIYICNDSLSYLKSSDDGLSWKIIKVPYNRKSNSENLFVYNSQIFFRVGNYPALNFLSSLDDGKSWSLLKTPGNKAKRFVNSPQGLLLRTFDPDKFYESKDNFKTWTQVTSFPDITSWDYISNDSVICISEVSFSGQVIQLSTDRGNTWSNLTSSFNGVNILAKGPNNSLYACTEDNGAYRSTNEGTTWEPILSEYSLNLIAFAGEDLVAINSATYGLYLLTNNCSTIIKASKNGLVDSSITSLVTFPDNIIIAGGYSKIIEIPLRTGGRTIGSKGGGLWKSIDLGNSWKRILVDSTFKTTDNGKTWLKFNKYKKKYLPANQPDLTVHSMAIVSKQDLLVQAKVDYKDGLYLSHDEGNTWHKLKDLDMYENAKVNLVSTSKGEVFCGMSRSTDGGKSFNDIINGLNSAVVKKIIPLQNGDVVAATTKGIYYLPFQTNTWLCVAFENAVVNDLDISKEFVFASVDYSGKIYRSLSSVYRIQKKNFINNLPVPVHKEENWIELNLSKFYGTKIFEIDKKGTLWGIENNNKYDDKCYIKYSVDLGKKWTKFKVIPDDFLFDFLPDTIHNMYWACTSGGLFKSDNQYNEWVKINLPVIRDKDDYSYVSVEAIALNNNGDLYVATSEAGPNRNPCEDTSKKVLGYFKVLGSDRIGRLYISKDGGKNWILSNSDLPAEPVSLFLGKDNKLFVAVSGEGLYYTTDLGKNWSNCNEGLLPKNVFYECNIGADLDRTVNTIKKDSKGNIYIVRGGTGIARTSNEGKTWKYLNSPHNFVNDIFLVSNNEIFIATSQGILRTNDFGITWKPFNSGLFSSSFNLLGTDKNGYLIAVSEDGRIYKTKKKIKDL